MCVYKSQEESKNISDNVRWGQRKRFADGKVSLPYKQFLGFEKGEDGRPAIVESEAASVRMIYRLFMEGMTPSAIAKRLTEAGILTPGGKTVWQVSTVKSILTNEKYRGDAILHQGNHLLIESNLSTGGFLYSPCMGKVLIYQGKSGVLAFGHRLVFRIENGGFCPVLPFV